VALFELEAFPYGFFISQVTIDHFIIACTIEGNLVYIMKFLIFFIGKEGVSKPNFTFSAVIYIKLARKSKALNILVFETNGIGFEADSTFHISIIQQICFLDKKGIIKEHEKN